MASEYKKILKNRVNEFKIKNSMNDLDDNHAISALHLKIFHKCDDEMALNQTSTGANDSGIDSWYFSESDKKLYIYQSKFSEDIEYVETAFDDLTRAIKWLESILISEKNELKKMNHSLENLFVFFTQKKDEVVEISFNLISCLDEERFITSKGRIKFEEDLEKSKLSNLISRRDGSIDFNIKIFSTSKTIISSKTRYNVSKLPNTDLALDDGTNLSLAYIPLFNLVKLYREMGDRLFEKNVRLSLSPFKDAKTRVFHPMESTLKQICDGDMAAELFTFFHIGVTISTKSQLHKKGSEYELEEPSVLNGCQTVTIASNFFRKLEIDKNNSAIEKFKSIKVVAKLVIGASDSELREITNCNNRQNPIEEWQLYCNDEIHLKIEDKFRELGVFYERQKGKFELIKHDPELMQPYPNTKMTYVKILEFAQVVAVCRNLPQFAAKPILIFSDIDSHNSFFNETLLKNSQNYILALNTFRALKSSLEKYQKLHEEYQVSIFKKPIIRIHLFHLGINYMFSRINNLEPHAIDQLQKVALPHLNEEAMGFYKKVMRKTKIYFMELEKEGREISPKQREKFFKDLAIETKINLKTII